MKLECIEQSFELLEAVQGLGAAARSGQGCLEEEHCSAVEGDSGAHAEAVREPAGDSD